MDQQKSKVSFWSIFESLPKNKKPPKATSSPPPEVSSTTGSEKKKKKKKTCLKHCGDRFEVYISGEILATENTSFHRKRLRFGREIPFISGESKLVKYYNLTRIFGCLPGVPSLNP